MNGIGKIYRNGEYIMPKEKRFEAMSLTIPFSIKKLDMYEVSNTFNENITKVYDYLADGKTVAAEVPNEDEMYKIYKDGNDIFVIEAEVRGETLKLEPMELINWLYAKIPFIPVIGIDGTR